MAAGRPTDYRAEYAEQSYKLCLLGATDKELAGFFEVAESTLGLWKLKHAAFSEAIKKGKAKADSTVAESLFKRANGYSHDAVKIVADSKAQTSMAVPYTEHYPPDTVACIFWLKNRQKEKWRDRTEHTGPDGTPIQVEIKNYALPVAK